MILIAERFGVLPDIVEEMDAFWYFRVVELMQGENLLHQEEERDRSRTKR